MNSAHAVKQKNVPGGAGGRVAGAGSSSTTSFRHQQAMRLAQMEKYIRKNALQVTFRDELNQAERREVVSTELEAKKLAFYLFWNVKADYARPNITRGDLADLLPSRDVDAAADLLDADGDGCISSQDVCAAILAVFRERENLAASLTDTKGVVSTLETMIGAVLHIFMFFIYLVIFGVRAEPVAAVVFGRGTGSEGGILQAAAMQTCLKPHVLPTTNQSPPRR